MTHCTNSYRFVIYFVILACFAIVGCGKKGPNTATVTGTITLDGRPAEAVGIKFFPERGRPGYGLSEKSGQYKIRFMQNSDGCIPGPNLVTFEAYSEPGNESSQYLPKRYNTKAEENPEMQVDVKPGKNVFNFDLLSK